MVYNKKVIIKILMTKIERVEPTIVEGVEFYVSSDGTQCGVSQVGLARLCGISETTIRRLMFDALSSTPMMASALKVIETCNGEDIYLGISSNQQAKVINSVYVAAIIEHYAFENKNPVALFSFRKFARIGIDTWIKEVIGFSNLHDQSKLQASINQVIEMLGDTNQRLKVLEEKTAGYQRVSVEMPGLKEWMESVSIDEQLALAPEEDEDLYTLAEYLRNEKHLSFDKAVMSKFSNQVSYVYKTMSLTVPGRKRSQTAQGYNGPPTNAYRKKDFPLLDIAFKQVMMNV
jgi:hypothetical protein